MIFDVRGIPAPKGSKRAVRNKHSGAAMLIDSGSKATLERLADWKSAVRAAAAAAVGDVVAPPFVGVPLSVYVTYYMPRPRSHWGTGKHAGQLKQGAPTWCATKPDKDKLDRCTLDVLTGIVFDDDSRIVDSHTVKRYAQPGHEGARITVMEAR